MYQPIEFKTKDRFSTPSGLTREKVQAAFDRAVARMEKNIELFPDSLAETMHGLNPNHPNGVSVNMYEATKELYWSNGTWTGIYWLLYQVTGDEKFRNYAASHLDIYDKVVTENTTLDDHDTGFKFTPSCVAEYKLTGNPRAREIALRAAEILLDHYCPVNQFIIRMGKRRPTDPYKSYRTLVDSMLNIPLFFWAYDETGNKEYLDAAVNHYRTTAKYLVREDGSTYHHYQFDPETFEPVGGVTFQGHRNESCWTRGHSWLLYGYPTAYRYCKNPDTMEFNQAVSYYFLDHLPSDMVPYWDFDFTDGSFEPRDSAAGAVAACGLLEACKHLPDDSEDKKLFQNAAEMLVEALIDHCEIHDPEKHALMAHYTGGKPIEDEIDTSCVYGDYFYIEALARLLNPQMEIFW